MCVSFLLGLSFSSMNLSVLILPTVSGNQTLQFRVLLIIRDCNGLSDAWACREGRDVGCQRVYFNSTRMRFIFAGSAIFVNEAVLILPIVSGDHSQQFRALLMCMTVAH